MMNVSVNPANASCITGELNWITQRVRHVLENKSATLFPLQPLDLASTYGQLITEHELSDADRVLFNLAFAANFAPEVLDPLAQAATDPTIGRIVGGLFHKGTSVFYPTVRTAVFLLAGTDIESRSYYAGYFHPKLRIFTSGLIGLSQPHSDSVLLDQQIIFNDQFMDTVLHGTPPRLDGEQGFPAKRSTATHTLTDVMLVEKTQWEIEKLRRFTRHMKKLWGINQKKKVRNNFISIFSGDPGTGKSHTAEAVGNEFGLPVYKVNFAQMVSKYIGETEKNLEKVFDRFDKQPSILFFDEAEAIFSKRTEVTDSHDQHANNLQSYLLQKVEEFNGIIILATNVQNLTQYFDKGFQRRYRLIVNFAFPDYPERLRMWNNALFEPFTFEEGLTEKLAMNYQFTGGSIYNVVSDAVLDAMDRESTVITFEILEPAMQDEFKKTSRKYEVCTDDMVGQNPVRRYGAGYEQRRNF